MLKSSVLILATVALAAFSKAGESSPTDPQIATIATIAVVADSVDIDAGKLAVRKAHDKRVKEFAVLMVRDHSAVNAKATALVKKLGVSRVEERRSRSSYRHLTAV